MRLNVNEYFVMMLTLMIVNRSDIASKLKATIRVSPNNTFNYSYSAE